jgi:ATP-dependent Clp protease ATP-binding subunit ClpA
LDEGFLTDAFGEKINFRNMIIIATSNAGSVLIKKMVEQGKGSEEIKKNLIEHIVENGIFRLEFLNRFDGIIFFSPLSRQELKSIVYLMLNKFFRRLAKEKNIEAGFEEEVAEKIIEGGYNPLFGARSLKRFIENKIENLIAKKIIAGEVRPGEKIFISASEL